LRKRWRWHNIVNSLRKRMAAARSEARVEAAACFEAGVEAVACSEAEDEGVACSGPRIENNRLRRHDGV
jgi:hypothetical protein